MSFINDLVGEVTDASASITAATLTTDTTGTGVDVTGGDPVVAFVQGSYTDGTHSFTISGKDGTAAWTSVTSGEKLNGTVPTISGTGDEGTIALVEVQADGNYDQLRVSSSVSGAGTGAAYGAHVLEINETTS